MIFLPNGLKRFCTKHVHAVSRFFQHVIKKIRVLHGQIPKNTAIWPNTGKCGHLTKEWPFGGRNICYTIYNAHSIC